MHGGGKDWTSLGDLHLFADLDLFFVLNVFD